MSKIIQKRLQALQFERKKNQNTDKIQVSSNCLNINHHSEMVTRNTLNQDKQDKNCGNKYIFSSSSSSSYSNSYSDDNDLPIGADKKCSKKLYTSKYHTYSEGSFSNLNKICAMRFQPVIPPLSHPTPPPSTNFTNGKEEEISQSKSGETYNDSDKLKQKDTEYYSVSIETASSNEYDDDDDDNYEYSKDTCDSFLGYSSDEDEDDDDGQVIQYDHLNPPKIHVAVRRDASLFKIEKISRENITPAFNLAEVPKISNLTQKAELDDEQNWLFSIPSTVQKIRVSSSHLTGGIFTPPESLEFQYNDNNRLSNKIAEGGSYKLDDDLCFIHVQKKAHQSLKSFITGTYQLNHLTVTKVNSSVAPYPGLHSAIDNSTRKSKLLLKIIIIALNKEACEQQRRFGFTFWWHKSVSIRNQEQRFKLQEEAKFAIAPDSLVKESLLTWIDSQNKTQGEEVQLPCLSKADSIMRDGKKIYVVYDPSLFLV